MKKNKLLLIITSLLLPNIVYASNSSSSLPVSIAIFMEAFVSIHMSAFVLKPMANIFSENEAQSKSLHIKLFIMRVIVLLIFDFFITTNIALFDFFAVFIGAFFLVPICSSIKKKPAYLANAKQQLSTPSMSSTLPPLNSTPKQNIVTPSNFDNIYTLSEKVFIETYIDREMQKKHISLDKDLIPKDALNQKKKLMILFNILLFIYVCLIFFHRSIYVYIIGAIILLICFKLSKNYNLKKYLIKEMKARPKEKISNIMMSVKNDSVLDSTKKIFPLLSFVALLLPVIIFWNPKIIYEKVDGGYNVRFYAFGVSNFTKADIPSTHNGENVIGLRGDAFANMYFLKEVNLPDTIIEIRGKAFKNDINLEKINIPKKLEYLGGASFYNCSSLKSIELPDTITYMGGETFYGATSLIYVKLPKNLLEIRGNTFEECISLRSIVIPDSVTRIGGHAFRGDYSLSEVILTKNSQLQEIGSSAFRNCDSLTSITLPLGVRINQRAFKESPTTIYYFNNNNYNNNYNNTYNDYAN